MGGRPVNYTLCVLSHGSLRMSKAAIHFFHKRVRPQPVQMIHHHDPGEGFCKATQHLWAQAAESGTDYVFWLEHDFRFQRNVNLYPIAKVLWDHTELAQVAFIRGPVNEQEREAGGVYEMHPPSDYRLRQDGDHLWLEHGINFTTNPSLMRREVMAANPWPDYTSQCEGRFSADFLEKGYRFAYWGSGEPWVKHIGPMRTGHSY